MLNKKEQMKMIKPENGAVFKPNQGLSIGLMSGL